MGRAARFLASLALLPLAAQAPPPQPDEIVVSGVRHRCTVRFADKAMSDREFNRRAAEWAAGKPVRVVSPPGMDHDCMVRIAFRLARLGVRQIEYVDRPEAVPAPTPQSPAAPATRP